MELKKYFNKQLIKKFGINFGIVFTVASATFLGLYVATHQHLPKNTLAWLLLIGVYALIGGVYTVINHEKNEKTETLIRDNYWKLKKELRGKVDKRNNRKKV